MDLKAFYRFAAAKAFCSFLRLRHTYRYIIRYFPGYKNVFSSWKNISGGRGYTVLYILRYFSYVLYNYRGKKRIQILFLRRKFLRIYSLSFYLRKRGFISYKKDSNGY